MKKILVIEDENLIRNNILELLEAEDFEPIGAENGSVGVYLARQHQPDLIICDVMMPDLDGYGVLTVLRQDPATAMIPFIFLTALTDRTDIRKGMELGADDYLPKPCTPDELLRAIATRLDKQATLTQHYTLASNQALEQINIEMSEQQALEADLHLALEKKQLQVYYQPQISTQTGKIVGAEALLRWHHPERGFISPAIFIPLAEKSDLILSIGEWVLSTACRQTKVWHTNKRDHLQIAVNLSGRQFDQLNLRQRLEPILTDTGLDPKYLKLELTESILVQNTELALKQLNSLKALGVQIAIDDFGTGYSSLMYLQQFPFDILKIDQCFIRQLNNPKTITIIIAIIQMAHSLHLKVIAEGVETEAELAFLREHNCDEIQGYLFSRPLPVAEFEKLLVSDLAYLSQD
jgi:EAL domain-containing protein (putative c-di-GMP-specific phosphodiesterase class I)/AmiR/NasT family two-component response regulator